MAIISGKTVGTIILISTLVAVSGCSRLRTHQGYIADPVLLGSVSVGVDNRESVQATLGRPTFASQFDDSQWYYLARDTEQLAFSRPKAKNQLLMKISFDEAGNVANVAQSGVETIVKINPDGDKTPTLGRDRSFFQDIFGNIGQVGAPGLGGGGGAPR